MFKAVVVQCNLYSPSALGRDTVERVESACVQMAFAYYFYHCCVHI